MFVSVELWQPCWIWVNHLDIYIQWLLPVVHEICCLNTDVLLPITVAKVLSKAHKVNECMNFCVVSVLSACRDMKDVQLYVKSELIIFQHRLLGSVLALQLGGSCSSLRDVKVSAAGRLLCWGCTRQKNLMFWSNAHTKTCTIRQ